ncbi:MAG: hypothetical protein KF852_11040 [Saprospiraceae bacterium]|nr:hypothetical protein [Saprospiraceae bacterium]
MKKHFFYLLLLLPFALSAQKIDVKQLKGLAIRNIGPAGMSGRVTAIDVDLNNPAIIYIGTASGGVWKSSGGGVSWEPIFDEQPTQSIGALTLNQRNTSEIWVGTGEGNPRNSHNSGEGIFKTLDAGKTWKGMGLEATKNIHRIIVHRDNSDVVFAGAMGSVWGPNPERGVFKTSDGGQTWKRVLYINDRTGCADLVVDPANPNKLIAAMWEYGRRPWTFNSGGPGSGIYVSHDGGENWTRRTEADGLPKGELGRVGLAVAHNKPNVAYAIVEAEENALYRSDDGGLKWRKTATENIGGRPFYYHDIFVDPKNENRVYSLHTYLNRSEDGGRSFETWVGWKVHLDHHAFWIHPDDPDYLITGNDGGLNISRDGGQTWQFMQNLPLGQFYHINYDMDVPYNIGGGMQDNGTFVGPSTVWQQGGIGNHHWQEVFFGDGFDLGFRPDDNRFVYAMSQGGNLGYVDRLTGKTQVIRPVHPEGVPLRFNWNAGFAQNPFHVCSIYYGSQFVHKSMDCGRSWQIISPDLTTNDPEKQKQHESGGLTIDNTAAENHTTIVAIVPSPINEQVIWVGTDDGNLQLTRNGGQSWTNLSARLTGVKPGSWIPYIEVSAKNAGEAFVIVSDYRRNDWRPMVFHTKDFGATFTRIADERQVRGHAQAIVQDPVEPNLLWLGTDNGLWLSIDGGKNWNQWTNGFPSVQTSDLKIHSREHDLIVATFGRAIWVLDDIRPIREIARTQGKVLEQPFRVFEAPDAYLANYKSYDGYHFPADAMFFAPNRASGALITVWHSTPNRQPTTEKANEQKATHNPQPTTPNRQPTAPKDIRAKVEVYDEAGERIRSFSTRIDTGMTRITWDLRRDGVRFPSRQEPRGEADQLPGGMEALPGKYKIVVVYGAFKDSTTLTVHDDPRRIIPMADRKAKLAAYAEYKTMVEKATQGFDQLKEARKSVRMVNDALANAPDSVKQEVTKMGKALLDSIAAVEKLYMMPDGLKGIQRSSDDLSALLRGATQYLNASDGAPNPNTQNILNLAKQRTAETLDRVNAFFEQDFAAYRQKVEGLSFSFFKPFEALKMDR